MMVLRGLAVGLAGLAASLVSHDTSAEHADRIIASDNILAENAAIKLRPSYQDCLDNGFIEQRPRIECAYDEYGFQDARLNASYKRLMDSLAPDEQLKLRAEEQKWIRERRLRCDFGAEPLPDYVLEAEDCELSEAAKRATELERRLAK